MAKGGELYDLLHGGGDGHQRPRGRASHVYIADVVNVMLVYGRHPSCQTLGNSKARGQSRQDRQKREVEKTSEREGQMNYDTCTCL